MRWFTIYISPILVVSVALGFAPPLCVNCGLTIKDTRNRSVSNAGRPLLWCWKCEPEQIRRWTGSKAAKKYGQKSYSDDLFEAELSSFQKRHGTNFAQLDGRKTYGIEILKRCSNPNCTKLGMCVFLDGQTEHRPDDRCHYPAWIKGIRKIYCSDACRKERARELKKLRDGL